MGGGIPVCVYDPKLGMFRVTSVRGKHFSSYGVIIPSDCDGAFDSSATICDEGAGGSRGDGVDTEAGVVVSSQKGSNTSTASGESPSSPDLAPGVNVVKSPPPPPMYLFIEEALFLLERGLLEVLAEDQERTLDSRALFGMLSDLGVALPVYLVYAHLRVQTFIVLRHTRQRLDIVDKLSACRKSTIRNEHIDQEGKTDGEKVEVKETSACHEGKYESARELKKRLRRDEAKAPAPTVLRWDDDCTKWKVRPFDVDANAHTDQRLLSSEIGLTPIAFDVYKPNAAFKRTDPGRPDYCVAVTAYAEPSPPFGTLHALVGASRGVPLRLATVADGGTVVMFSLTDYGVPDIRS